LVDELGEEIVDVTPAKLGIVERGHVARLTAG